MIQGISTSLISVAVNFLETLRIPFTEKILKQHLEYNPYYPSLYSISQVLNKYNIANKALQIENEQLDKLPVPFLAYLNIQASGIKDFVNVTNVSRDSVTFFYEKEKTVTRKEFIDSWSNIVLLAEVNDKSKEKDYHKNKREIAWDKNKMYLVLLGFGLVLLGSIFNFVSDSYVFIASLTLLASTFIGLAISILLLIYEVDRSNAFVKNICSGGIKINCDAVLGSGAAKMFGISWAEIGLFYFSFLVLFLLIPGIPFIDKIPFISYLFILSAMYLPFSLYYQYKVVKQWCRLCLFAQGVLFLNLCWAIGFGSFIINFSISNMVFFTGCAIFPVLLWYTLKPIIVKAKDADKYLTAYKRLYTHPDIFKITLANQPDISNGWQNLGIQRGNPGAKNIILKVCSPSCSHCIISHAIFNDILISNSDVQVVTIYGVTNDEKDDRRLPVKHFLALAEQGEGKHAEAMDYWYLNEKRNYNELKANFLVSDELLEKQAGKIDQMRDWCKAAEIDYTPTVFVNGKKLPGTFNLADLQDIFL